MIGLRMFMYSTLHTKICQKATILKTNAYIESPAHIKASGFL